MKEQLFKTLNKYNNIIVITESLYHDPELHGSKCGILLHNQMNSLHSVVTSSLISSNKFNSLTRSTPVSFYETKFWY